MPPRCATGASGSMHRATWCNNSDLTRHSSGCGSSTWRTARQDSAVAISTLPNWSWRGANESSGGEAVVTVYVSTQLPLSRVRVWDELARIEDHVTWMKDARAIRFRSDQRQGIGTSFECDTKLGPLHLTDMMEVTEWEVGESIGVRHVGAVSGSGRFSLRDAPGPATIVEWEERLLFPRWLGAGLG